jgi:ubiquinol-cytochrome c reductase iron-sulfur subunit
MSTHIENNANNANNVNIERFQDPGLPEHVHRKADSDPAAAKRAEQQVAVLFLLSAAGTVATIASYIFVHPQVYIYIPILGSTNVQQMCIGLGLTIATITIGLGAVQWAKKLMPDTEQVQERHEFRSSDKDRQALVDTVEEHVAEAGIARRPLIKRTLGLALGVVGLSPLVLLRDLGPMPGKFLDTTDWSAGTRLMLDPANTPIRPEDLEVGAVSQVLPELKSGVERTLENTGKDAVLLIRLRPEDFNLDPERLSWTYNGIIAFSKICTHMGCAVALYEQQTHHLLCPCHQSTFDVTRAAKVIFGPAARPLPQLAITVDANGYLVAKQPFTLPVGPSFWERNSING